MRNCHVYSRVGEKKGHELDLNCRYSFIISPRLRTRRTANDHCLGVKSLLAEPRRVPVLRYSSRGGDFTV